MDTASTRPRESQGQLTMAATHLGDPRDLPSRSLEALKSADLLIFEEDRPARSFLKAAGIHRDYLKYSEHGQKDTVAACRQALKAGQSVLYMSDQGTPGLSDPGRDLLAVAYELEAKVSVIPGPSSITAAISVCPFDCWAFHFLGFLPRETPTRMAALRAAAAFSRPLVIMDVPYRLKALLAACEQVFGKSRRGFLALDISGTAEDFWLGSFETLQKKAEQLAEKLNFVLIVDGASS